MKTAAVLGLNILMPHDATPFRYFRPTAENDLGQNVSRIG